MTAVSCPPQVATVSALPTEDIVVLASGTPWHVPWELMMVGPFVSCGLLDGRLIRHVTVPTMIASAVRQGSAPDAALVPADYRALPVFPAEMPVLDAAASVVESGWDLAIVMADEPRVITARSVYRALVVPPAIRGRMAMVMPMPRAKDVR
jgi:hypothetical protein